MAAVTPSSDLYLLQCPIEIDNKNQINFSNASTQFNYFNGLYKIGATNFSYQRKDSTIRYPAHIDSIRHFNYCMYRNDNYSNKWFYAFIEDMEYLNDSTTLIKIKTDCYQTWQFDLNFKRSFVEREHVNDDSIGKHTLDEGLPTGEPIINHSYDYVISSNANDQQRFCAQVTQLPDGVTVPSGYDTRVYNGIPQGCYLLVFDGPANFNKFATWYDKKGQRDAIVAFFIVPQRMVSTAHYQNYNIGEGVGSTRVGFLPATYLYYNFDSPSTYYSSTLDGYTPANKKLYCYPYSYMNVSNNAGSVISFKYEDFQDPTHPAWNCHGVISQGCEIRLYPHLYKHYSTGPSCWDYGLTAPKMPILSWQSDYYLNWQAQNGVNQAIQTATNVVKDIGNVVGGIGNIASGKASGASGVIGGTMDVVSDISSAIHEQQVAELVPVQARGNINCADLSYVNGKCAFTFQRMSCRREYAVMLDTFFSMFGYKVNEVKVPNITGRRNWNFVKTKQCNILANIPQEDLDEIKDMFNSGVTIWHNASTFLDYSQSNPII